MRRKGVDEAWSALEEMQHNGATTDKYTISRMLMKTVGDSNSRLDPARAYRAISLVERFVDMQPKDVDEVLFNALLDTCCRLKDLNRLESCVKRMHELEVNPSPVTLGILVKTYGQAGDLQKVLKAWNEMEKQRGLANAVTYGCMLDACVKCGNLDKAIEVFKGMRETGKHRNTIIYTTMIKGYGMEKDLASALELFREMPKEGVPYNTITYNSILEACVKCGEVPQAETLLQELMSPESGLQPDLISFSTLLKGYCQFGELDKALNVAQSIKARGLRCDELVYNTLMDGCVKANDVSSGIGLFEEMLQMGLRPSAITSSILTRLYQRAGFEEDANEKVNDLYKQFGLERPTAGDRQRGSKVRTPGGRRSPVASPAASVSSEVSGFGFVPPLPSSSPPPLQNFCTHQASLTGPVLPLAALRGPPAPGPFSPYSNHGYTPTSSLAGSPCAGASLMNYDGYYQGSASPASWSYPYHYGNGSCSPVHTAVDTSVQHIVTVAVPIGQSFGPDAALQHQMHLQQQFQQQQQLHQQQMHVQAQHMMQMQHQQQMQQQHAQQQHAQQQQQMQQEQQLHQQQLQYQQQYLIPCQFNTQQQTVQQGQPQHQGQQQPALLAYCPSQEPGRQQGLILS